MGDFPIDDRVVVGEHHGAPTIAAQPGSDCTQTLPKGRVMVRPCIAGDSPVRSGRSDRLVEEVGAGTDEHGLRAGDGTLRVGRANRILERELQAVGESGDLPADQFGACSLQDVGIAHAHRIDAVSASDVDELVQVIAVS
jgi:hypothetical protein